MSDWWKNLTPEQIEWLKTNRVSNRGLTDEEFRILGSVPSTELQTLMVGGDWEPIGRINSRAKYDTYTFRLRPDWEPPTPEPEWVDVVPKPSNDTLAWMVIVPTYGPVRLAEVPSFRRWLLTRYEWVDDKGWRYQWDARMGDDCCAVPDDEQTDGDVHYWPPAINNNTPARPILVRFPKTVPDANAE